MTNFARVVNNVAVDVSSDPESHFHPDIAAQFESVPNNVERGWILVDDEWEAPAALEPESNSDAAPILSPIRFKLLFTPAERVAMKVARETDPVLNDFFELVDDPRLTQVDLNLTSTQSALDHLVTEEFITEARKEEIMQGQFQ